jgi:hypothetical protein
MISNPAIHQGFPWPPHAHRVMPFWFHEYSYCYFVVSTLGSQHRFQLMAGPSLPKVFPMFLDNCYRIHNQQILCPWRHFNLPPSSPRWRINLPRYSPSKPNSFWNKLRSSNLWRGTIANMFSHQVCSSGYRVYKPAVTSTLPAICYLISVHEIPI